MRPHIIPALILCLFVGYLNGQNTFQTSIGGTNLNSALETESGEIFSVGWNWGDLVWSDTNYYINQGMVLLKVNSEGDTLWSRIYTVDGKTEFSRAESITGASDGGLLIGGGCYECDSTGNHFILIRTDENGDTLWTKKYLAEAEYGMVRSIIKAHGGGFILAGAIGLVGGSSGAMVLKVSENGNIIWSKKITSSFSAQSFSVIENSDSTITVAGSVNEGISPDLFIAKLDKNGDLIWSRTIGGIGYDIGFALCHSTDGGFMLTGGVEGFGSGSVDICLISLDADGNFRWSKIYGGTGGEDGKTILRINSGYLIGGYTNSFGNDIGQYYILKTDFEGNLEWSNVYTQSYGHPSHFVATSDDLVLAVGWMFEMMKFTIDGTSSCEQRSVPIKQLDVNVEITGEPITIEDISFETRHTGMKIISGLGEVEKCLSINTTEFQQLVDINIKAGFLSDLFAFEIFKGSLREARLIDVNGRIVSTTKNVSYGNTIELQTSYLYPGIYFLQVDCIEGSIIQKVIKF